MPNTQKPFKLELKRGGPLRNTLFTLLERPLEQILCFPAFNDTYAAITRKDGVKEFLDGALKALNVDYRVSAGEMARIPAQGPAVVVANHPFGMIEGVVLGSILYSVRPDVKVLANFLLDLIPDLRDMYIQVDNFGRRDSWKHNLKPLKESLRLLKGGGMLAAFPSGAVSHVFLRQRAVTDPAWSPTIAGIVRRSGAPVLPVYFHGRNSALFQTLGLVHPMLRTIMLPREMLNKRSRSLQVSVGRLIPNDKLARFETDEEMIAYLRMRTYMLGSGNRPAKASKAFPPPARREPAAPPQAEAPLRQGPTSLVLAAEVASLPPEARLLESGDYEVYMAKAQGVPHIVDELGRLRAVSFREVGEGSGADRETDRFDAYYDHIFVWNRERSEIVGAYRLGRSDEIVPALGVEGLYTSTLFTYRPRLFEHLGPALEMGRSFVRPEYQKNYSPLLLLWKGIGRFVAENPRYRVLFGPVSISNDYSPLSREILVRHLKAHAMLSDLAKLVKPNSPPRLSNLRSRDVRQFRAMFNTIDDVTAVITDIEKDEKGIPVLLKQYLKLGGKVLAFNVDQDFSCALDGLLLVDLTRTDPKVLARYLGEDGARAFLERHGESGPPTREA